MAVSDAQLETWSHLGSEAQSASTYETIKNALNDPKAPYHSQSYEIFLQGSYGNKTNIWADSDVDIVIRLDSVYYSDTRNLSAADKQNYDSHFSKAEYRLSDFKQEVFEWLRLRFGQSVKIGKKCIKIPGSNGRRDADVLVCAEHRDYETFPAIGQPTFWLGVVFWTTEGEKVVNYPRQHLANCTTKHQSTNQLFKRSVRIFKNMRNKMVEDGMIDKGLAPSYFLEGLLSNVPNQSFQTPYRSTVSNSINYILNADRTQFTCANNIHWLLSDGHSVCWPPANYEVYMFQLRKFWG
jgi:hypothetical protein|tara:strand:+ start:3502 stop:4386 length:885 start_codon:yes stop_codon:yes gene_type:complete